MSTKSWSNYREEVGSCERCGASKRLTVHHLIPQSVARGLRSRRSNWIVLCRDCHDWVEQTKKGQVWQYTNYGDRMFDLHARHWFENLPKPIPLIKQVFGSWVKEVETKSDPKRKETSSWIREYREEPKPPKPKLKTGKFKSSLPGGGEYSYK